MRAAARTCLAGSVWLWMAGVMTPAQARARVLDEFWIGGFAHDVDHIGAGRESNTADIQIEIDSARPSALRAIGSPRINFTLSENSAGLTNFGAIGFTWDRRLWKKLEGSFDLGIALTDGVTGRDAPSGSSVRPERLLLGSKAQFREAAGLAWRVSDRWSIGVEFVHLSNGHILARDHNDGVNDAGLRLGYRFP